jgi:hypothetical protein
MTVLVQLAEQGDGWASFKGSGEADGQSTVSAKLTLARYNLADRNPAWKETDERLVRHWRDLYSQLRVPAA